MGEGPARPLHPRALWPYAEARDRRAFLGQDSQVGWLLGVDRGAYDACLEAKGTLDRLQRESNILRGVGFQGLPTTYIGPRQIVGARAPEVFQDALAVAAEQESDPGVPGWAYVLIVLAVATATVQFGRPRPHGSPKLTTPA